MERKQKEYDQFRGKPRPPNFLVPKRFDLKLKPDLAACKFSGTVHISVDVVANTRFIVLNAVELSVHPNSVRFCISNRFKDDEILVLEFVESLPIGVGVLWIAFDGTLNDKMKGFYISTYEHHGEKKNMAVTQFASTDARRCFPCWDEPVFKVLPIPTPTMRAQVFVCNTSFNFVYYMPIVKEKVDGNLKTVYYLESPVMPTYLVAVVVSLFDYVEDHTPDGTVIIHIIFILSYASCGPTPHNQCNMILEL
ncbi:hypothetical protein LguiB_009676 [Lonicera macranthoides]